MERNNPINYPEYLRSYVDPTVLERIGNNLPPRSDRNLLIAGGGLDLSGKTTTLLNLAAETGAQYTYCMDDNPLDRWRKHLDNSPIMMRYLYYLAVPLLNYRKLEKLREKGTVLLDQSVYSTIAYHLAYGLDPRYIDLVPNRLLDQVDALVFLTAPKDVRQSRLEERKSNNGGKISKSDLQSIDIGERVESHYLAIRPEQTLVVSTHDKSQDEVVEVIRRELLI